MAKARKRRWSTAAEAAALMLAFAVTWTVLDRTEHRPRWITVEVPGTAVVGQKFEVRVTLDRSVEPTEISCTLHRANAERRGWGYLASSGPARPAVGGGTYAFAFDVPEKKDTAFVFALVYLSPSGQWQDGTRAVATKLIPAGRNGAGAEGRRLRRIALYSYPTASRSAAMKAAGGPPERRRPSAWVHPALAALLLAAAFFAWNAGRKDRGASPEAPGERTIWLLFAAVLAVSAVVELSGFAGHLAALGRRLAEQGRVYEFRRPVQKAVIAAVASASLWLFLLFIRATRRAGSHRALWWAGIGLAGYLAVSFAGVLSFHAVDVVRDRAWLGISPFDALRGAGVLDVFLAAFLSVRRKDDKIPI